MSQDHGELRQSPAIDAAAAVQRQLLQAERRLLEARLRAAWLAGDGSTGGSEAQVRYQELQDRRQVVVAALSRERQHGRAAPSGLGPRLWAVRPDQPIAARPIAAPVFDPGTGVFGFGSAGTVQLAPAAVGTSVIPPAPCSGEIDPVFGSAIGEVAFGGALATDSGDPNAPPSTSGVWLQTWQYLVPFPPAPVLSVFSYSFQVYAVDMIFISIGTGRQVLSFVSLGETPDLLTGDVIAVDIDAGWPLDADLTQPGPEYDGNVGLVEGQLSVQRSFLVPAYQVPGVAIVVGAAAALAPDSAVDLAVPDWGIFGDSHISIGTGLGTGTIAYSYEPHLVVAP